MKLSEFNTKATKLIFVANKSIGGIKCGKTYLVKYAWECDGIAMVDLELDGEVIEAKGRHVISAMFKK